MSETALPISWPYFHTVSPALMSVSATLWPIGTSILDLRAKAELSAVTTQVMSVPAFRPSTTTTPDRILCVVNQEMGNAHRDVSDICWARAAYRSLRRASQIRRHDHMRTVTRARARSHRAHQII